jgi:nucleoid-associated protein EbfC
MNMFDMMKQAKDMYSKMKTVQKNLEARKINIDCEGVKITGNGKQEILSLTLDDKVLSLGKDKIEKILLKAFNEMNKETTKIIQEESKSLTGGMSIPGITDLIK